MKRVYWLLIAAVPVLLWWLSQSGASQEAKPAAPKPSPEPVKTETPSEQAKDLPTSSNSSNGTFPKPSASKDVPPSPVGDGPPAGGLETSPTHPEQTEQEPEVAPPAVPESEVEQVVEEAAADESAGELVQIFDSRDQSLECQLIEVTTSQALLRCPVELPEKEKVRLVLPFSEQAITVNAQLQAVEEGVSRFKIMTLKAGQKKRFEEYLAQRTL